MQYKKKQHSVGGRLGHLKAPGVKIDSVQIGKLKRTSANIPEEDMQLRRISSNYRLRFQLCNEFEKAMAQVPPRIGE